MFDWPPTTLGQILLSFRIEEEKDKQDDQEGRHRNVKIDQVVHQTDPVSFLIFVYTDLL